MQIYGAYARSIIERLFAVSTTPNPAGRIHVVAVRDAIARHTARTVTHALKRQAPACTVEHLIGRIRRRLAGHRMTHIHVGQVLVATLKTLEPEAAE